MFEPGPDPTTVADGDLLALAVEAARAAEAAQAYLLRVVGQVEATTAWKHDGAVSCASWLTEKANMKRSEAGGLVKQARLFHQASKVADAVACGAMPLAKAKALLTALNPRDAAAFAEQEDALIAAVADLTIVETAELADEWKRRNDEDGPTPPAPDPIGTASCSQAGDTVHLSASLHGEGGAPSAPSSTSSSTSSGAPNERPSSARSPTTNAAPPTSSASSAHAPSSRWPDGPAPVGQPPPPEQPSMSSATSTPSKAAPATPPRRSTA